MNTLLFLLLAIPRVVESQFYTPECLTNYTSFFNSRYDAENNTLLLINDTQADKCSDICYNYSNCTGFSYIPSPWHKESQCILTTLPFRYISLDYDLGSAFYLKSYNSCSFYSSFHYLIIILAGLALLALCTCCCYKWGRRQIRSEYRLIK